MGCVQLTRSNGGLWGWWGCTEMSPQWGQGPSRGHSSPRNGLPPPGLGGSLDLPAEKPLEPPGFGDSSLGNPLQDERRVPFQNPKEPAGPKAGRGAQGPPSSWG